MGSGGGLGGSGGGTPGGGQKRPKKAKKGGPGGVQICRFLAPKSKARSIFFDFCSQHVSLRTLFSICPAGHTPQKILIYTQIIGGVQSGDHFFDYKIGTCTKI